MARRIWGNGEGGEKRSYHHGRLKEALIEAARALVARHGPAGFTLAEAAKVVGVTPAAPYRHFTDRDELISELAREGFEKFGDRLWTEWDEGRPDVIQAFRRMGAAYLAFAQEEPGYYFTMFGHAQKLASPAGQAAAQRALDAVIAGARGIFSLYGAPADGAPKLAYEIWAISHGVATLMLGRHFEPGHPDSDPFSVLDRGVTAMIEKAVTMARQAL